MVEPAAPRRAAVYDFGPNAFDLTDDEDCASGSTPPDGQAEGNVNSASKWGGDELQNGAEYGATPPQNGAANGIRGGRAAETDASRADQIDLSGAAWDPVPWWSE